MPDLTSEALWLRMSWTRFLSPDTFIGALVVLLLFGIAGMLVTRLLTRTIALVLERDHNKRIDRLVATFIEQFARAFVWLIILMLYAHTIPALDRLATALLASVSIASVVLGLAAQSTLANFVSGVSLLFYRPFRIGDRLQVSAPGGVETGTVESVSLGYTTLQTFDNRRIVMPNSVISSATMINLSSVSAKVMAIIPFSIGYGADIDKARAIALGLADANRDVQQVVSCPVVALNSSSVDMALRVWCADSSLANTVKFDLTEEIKKRFDTEGIEIPYPYQNVMILEKPAMPLKRTGPDQSVPQDGPT